MVREEKLAMAVHSNGGSGMTGQPQQPLMMRYLHSTSAANAQEPSWFEADPVGWDAPISVWWDERPGSAP